MAEESTPKDEAAAGAEKQDKGRAPETAVSNDERLSQLPDNVSDEIGKLLGGEK
ncbi:hypothetical protein SXANM310S_00461 [Streptomyces xanthochromogenes]